MINISSEFKSKLQNRDMPYTVQVQITLAGGTVLNLTNEHILEDGLNIEDAISDDSSFNALGAAVINSANITLNNAYGDFSNYDFKDATVKIKVGFELSQETELIDKGIFVVDDATYTDFAVRLSCLDNMVKFDKPYSQSTLVYPATLSAIVRDACTKCGVTLATSTFPHSTFSIANKPIDETTTFREVISWAAQIAGCYARINTKGQLELKWFDTSVLVDSLDGGYFDNGTPRYRSGDTADGGSFNPWNIGYESDAGVFTDTDKYHVFAHLFTEDIAVDDTVITGVQIAVRTEDEQSNNVINYYTAGVDGYKITIENNELITVDNAQTIVNWLGIQLISLRFRKVSITHVNDPSIEAGDVGLVYARNSGPYEILITRTNFTPTNSQRTVCASETPVRNSSTKYTEASKNYVALQKKIAEEKTAREQDIEDLAEAIARATGMYNTSIQAGQVDPATGQTVTSGSIVYLHDRPLLAESAAVWRMSADAFSVTNNYNGTSTVWIAGLTVDGTLVAEKLSAVGVNADWINAGAISISDPNDNETFYADTQTGVVRIVASQFTLTGQTIPEIAQNALSSFTEAVTQDLESIHEQLDGVVDTYYFDYMPTANNYPANEWTTTALKEDHEGDLFLDTSTGKSYRWVKENNVWQWKEIPDTASAQALVAAQHAQDTADGKRRVFLSTPTPPYDRGDLWAQGTSGDILTCTTAKADGAAYSSADWSKLNKYTDDTAVNNLEIGGRNLLKSTPKLYNQTAYNFIQLYLTEKLEAGQEYTFQAWGLTLDSNSSGTRLYWGGGSNSLYPTTAGYIFPDSNGYLCFRFTVTQAQAQHSQAANLWLNMYNFVNGHTDMNASISKWKLEKGSKATDWSLAPEDIEAELSALESFVNTELSDVQTQIDGKIESFYQSTDPSTAWTTTELKSAHKGDIWTNSSTGKSYRWSGTAWKEMTTTPPSSLVDKWDGKATIFTAQPTPPYQKGDLWFNSATSDILTCMTARASGSYTASDWVKRNKYTDDTAADAAQTTADTALSRATAHYGTSSTAASTAAKVVTCSGFSLYTGAQIIVKFTYGNTSTSAMTLNVNSTGAKYVRAGDANVTASSVYNWKTANQTRAFVYDGTYWQLQETLYQTEVFNALTSNGTLQGIFMQDGKLYINMEYLKTGVLKLGGSTSNGELEVYNVSGTRIGRWDRTGLYIGNIAGSGSRGLTSPNTKITTGGSITTNSLTSNDYIFVDGNSSSSIIIPINSGGTDFGLTKLHRYGLLAQCGDYAMLIGGVIGDSINNGIRVAMKSSNNYGINDNNQGINISAEHNYIRAQYYGYDCSISAKGANFLSGYYNGTPKFTISKSTGNAWFAGALSCGGAKPRLVQTKDYGYRYLYCYETPTPMFGDIGDGKIGEDGKCYVQIDNVFSETVSLSQYQVFLQKYGEGECWVAERNSAYFVVEGTVGLSFGWEIKAKQSDFDQLRLEKEMDDFFTKEQNNQKVTEDYMVDFEVHMMNIKLQREVNPE